MQIPIIWFVSCGVSRSTCAIIPANAVLVKPVFEKSCTFLATNAAAQKFPALKRQPRPQKDRRVRSVGGGRLFGLTAPEIAKMLLLYPDEPNGDYAGDYHWFNPVGERLPLCGGNWYNGANAGVFNLNLNNPRSNANWNIGFRSALPSSQMLQT